MKVNEHLSILFLLERSKMSADGLVPIYVRITIDGSRSPFSTGSKVLPENWDQDTEQVKISAKNKDQAIINVQITQIRARLTTHYFVLDSQHKYVTAEMVKMAYQGKPTDEELEKKKIAEKTICQVYNYKHSKFMACVKAGHRAPSSITKWKTTKKKLRQFLNTRFKAWDIPLVKIKYSLAQDFFDYLVVHDSIGSNAANKYVKNVKELFNIACDREWLQVNPWNGFEARYVQPEREVLSMDDISKLYNKKGLCERLDDVRNIFLFACFTGYAFKELQKLTPEAIFIGDDGKEWIKIGRQKTKNPEGLPLLPIPAAILEKYSEDDYCKKNGVLLPVDSNQKYNEYLKELAAICDISVHLTTHVARHTFATTICLDHGVPIETVSKMLGHTVIKTTQIYAKISKLKIRRDMNALHGELFNNYGKLKFAQAIIKSIAVANKHRKVS